MSYIATDAEISGIRLITQVDPPATPTAGHCVFYIDANGPHFRDENGHVWALTATDEGDPTPPGIIWADDFHRANAANLGGDWVPDVAGIMGIDTNRAVSTATWLGGPLAYTTNGSGVIVVSNYAVEVVFDHSCPVNGTWFGPVVRGNISAGWQALAFIFNGGNMHIVNLPGFNVVTTMAWPASFATNQNHTVRVDCVGNVYTITVDGTLFYTYTENSHDHDAGSIVGIGGDAGGTTNYIVHSFTVYSVS